MDKYLIIADIEGKRQPAIHRGIELAKRSGAGIHLVAFVYDEYVSEQDAESSASLQEMAVDTKRKQIDEIINDIDCADVPVTTEVVWEQNISSWVIKQAKTDKFSMIIKTGRRSETLIHTPSDWQIFRESPLPIMIVAEKKWRQKNNVMCAIDLGAKKSQRTLNRKIIEQGKALAEMLNGELFCCYAIPMPTVLIDLEVVDRRRIEKKGREKAKAQFATLADEFGLDASALHMKVGKAQKVIPSIANKLKARMVVVGTVGRKGLKGKLIGNTAEQVVHHLRTDMLAIKP